MLHISKAHKGLRNPMTFFWLFVAAVVIGLDAWTKYIANTQLVMFQPVEVTAWLNWRLAHNPGAAFSLLANAGGWQRWFFTVLAVGVSVFLLSWLFKLERHQRLLPLALSLVLGGAIGNVIDRLVHGYVIDFIDVHVAGYHWPSFNIADSAITCGIILLLIDAFRETLAERRAKQREEAA
jgi:signal peptidase II